MQNNRVQATNLMLAHEGGYVNHPADPGGATNKGVTQRVYDAYRRNKGQEPRSVRQITNTEVQAIYREQYWDRVQGDRLPAGLDYAVFDYAVNSGTGRAVKELQRVLGVPADGDLGNITLQAAERACAENEEAVIENLCARRMRFLRSLKTFGTFGRGWTRRVMGDRDGFQEGDHGVIDYAIMMARGDNTYRMPSAIGSKAGEVNGRGTEADVAQIRTKPGIGAALASSGVTGQTVMSAAEQVQPHVSESPFGKIALICFIVLMVAGGALLAWSFYQRLKEKGAL